MLRMLIIVLVLTPLSLLSTILLNLDKLYAEDDSLQTTSARVIIATGRGGLFLFNVRAVSTPTDISGSGMGRVNGQVEPVLGFPTLDFRYSINSLFIRETVNGVNGEVGKTAYMTATVTQSSDTSVLPVGTTFSIIGNDPCCATDPSLKKANSASVVNSFQIRGLGGIYTSGIANILTWGV